MTALLNRLQGDRVIWMTALFLALISLLAVYSSVSSLAFKKSHSTTFYLLKHGMMLLTGGVIMYYASRLRHGIYARLAQLLIGVVAVLLLLTLLIGSEINEANRWIRVPIIGQTFQTSDMAKVVLMVYLARVLAKHQGREWTMRDVVLKLVMPVGVICALILPADFSTAALLFGTCLVLMFIGQVPVKWIATIVGMAVGAFMAMIALNESLGAINEELTFLPRVETWVNRFATHGEEGHVANHQVEHAKIAIASGGFLPNGPGSGASRNWLPHPYSDMIYAFIIEEYGSLFGGLGLLLLYLILLFRAVRVAGRCDKPFGALVAMGLSLMLVLQAMVNMAVAVNLVPVTGQPLPLVSMGGTSIWFTCLAIGIVLSVSRAVEENANETKSHVRPATA